MWPLTLISKCWDYGTHIFPTCVDDEQLNLNPVGAAQAFKLIDYAVFVGDIATSVEAGRVC